MAEFEALQTALSEFYFCSLSPGPGEIALSVNSSWLDARRTVAHVCVSGKSRELLCGRPFDILVLSLPRSEPRQSLKHENVVPTTSWVNVPLCGCW